MVDRLLRSADFVRVLAVPPRARSAHFALHHLAAEPSRPARVIKAAAQAGAARQVLPKAELSTVDAHGCPPPVDDAPGNGGAAPLQVTVPTGHWLGTVVPKRHAKRAVTRNLIKRQMRALMADQGALLPAGLWVLRLKAPFDPKQFLSAASAPLRASARGELLTLIERARDGRGRATARG